MSVMVRNPPVFEHNRVLPLEKHLSFLGRAAGCFPVTALRLWRAYF